VLPFCGRAEYVLPELELWLGFTAGRPHYLCATSELSSMLAVDDRPPRLQCVWRDLS
jgi:hypothetical protein